MSSLACPPCDDGEKKAVEHHSEQHMETEDSPSSQSVSCSPDQQQFAQLLGECLSAIESTIVTQDPRFVSRMLRRIYSLKRLFHLKTFCTFIKSVLVSHGCQRGDLLISLFLDVDPSATTYEELGQTTSIKETDQPQILQTKTPTYIWSSRNPKDRLESLNEIDLFLSTVSLMVLLDMQRYDAAKKLADSLITQLSTFPAPKKYEDQILAKVLFWIARVYDLQGNLSLLRGLLMNIYRTSVLHTKLISQVVALNILLQSFSQDGLHDQAVKLIEKSPYPEELRLNTQHARYLYYLARINAVRANYNVAHSKIVLALRKAPQEGSSIGIGFRTTANKLYIVIQLLRGEIPERKLFYYKNSREALVPYAEIVKAVRSGDLVSFQLVMEKHQELFMKDRNWILIQRLHYNVIRTGLRRITTSYCEISLDDVTSLLGLGSTDDTVCIVAKAIADQVIDAKMDLQSGVLLSQKNSDSKSLLDPRKAFHSRISYCLQVYNESLKVMQYPDQPTDANIEEAEARRREHQEQLARAEKEELDGDDAADLI